MLKKVYICSANTGAYFKTSANKALYKTLFGFLDAGKPVIHITGVTLTGLEAYIEEQLKEKLKTIPKEKESSYEITVLGKKMLIDLRNVEHALINALNVLLQMIHIEQQQQGGLWIFDISTFDNTDAYLLMFIQEQEMALAARDYYNWFIHERPGQAISYEKFTARAEKLVLDGFLNRQEKDGETYYSATYKTGRIHF